MRHPIGLLLLVVFATARCAGAGCNASGDAPHDFKPLGAPEAGKNFTSCYGATVERLTDHEKEGVAFIQAEYATQSHLNADGSIVKVEFPDGTVRFFERASREWLKPVLRKAGSPVWHPGDPNVLLYVDEGGGGVEIRRMDVRRGKSEDEFRTRDYRNLDNLGEADISPDGNKLVFLGTTRGGDKHVVVYDRERGGFTDGALDVTGKSVNWLQVTNTRVLVGFNLDPGNCAPDIPEPERFYDGEGRLTGCQPLRVYGTNLEPVWEGGRTLLVSHWGHGDVGIDAGDRNREIWVMSNANKILPNPNRFPSATAVPPEGCWNSLVKYRLDEPTEPTCLRPGPAENNPAYSWDLAIHVALPAAPSRHAYVTFFRTQGDSQYEPLAPPTPDPPCPQCTVPFQNEIVRVRLDGKGFERMTHHYSSRHVSGGGQYNWQPRASVDAAGKWLLFNSNFGTGDANTADVFCLPLSR